ncbi:MAG TPA: hypothetical protein ENK85_02765 [Saprospiraceae bacterium]|nr:hypothetical protein [Saprospiraceae bacterium]
MRYTIILILCISFFQKSFSQENQISIIEEDGLNSVVITNSKGEKEILAQFAYKITLLDTKILSLEKVSFIIEAPLHVQYEKYVKNDNGEWERSNTSGILGSNNYLRSVPLEQDLNENKRTYQIISEDLVQINDSSNKYTKDCREFIVEREKWIEDCRKSKKH